MNEKQFNLLLEMLGGMRLSEASLQAIQENIRMQQVKGNSVLLTPGAVCSQIYLVLEGGFVCRYINDTTGEAKTINFYLNDLHPFMACVDSYFTQTPTQCELRAIADSVVFSMPKKAIDQLILQDEQLKNFYHAMVITALQEENDLKLKIIAYSSEELYRYLIDHLSMVIQKVPSKYIAEFMGISAEWLSKLKRNRR